MTAPAAGADASRQLDGQGAPRLAVVLTWLGLVPFVLCAAGAVILPAVWGLKAMDLLRGYGMVVLAFTGAVHWGAALFRHVPFPQGFHARLLLAWGVAPALIGWAALALPMWAGLWVLAGGFVAALAADRLAVGRGLLPSWYWRLRLPVTCCVVAVLVFGALFEMRLI